MLGQDDLNEINNFFKAKLSATTEKIKGERNPKIVNYKIRSFIEKIRDKLKKYEPVTFIDSQQTIVNKANQLDRIELTVGQVLNEVQKLAHGAVKPTLTGASLTSSPPLNLAAQPRGIDTLQSIP